MYFEKQYTGFVLKRFTEIRHATTITTLQQQMINYYVLIVCAIADYQKTLTLYKSFFLLIYLLIIKNRDAKE